MVGLVSSGALHWVYLGFLVCGYVICGAIFR